MTEKTILDKLAEGRQYRAFVDIAPTDEKTVEGYASTFNDPYLLYDDGSYKVYEQIDPRAFDRTDMRDVIMQYNHEGRVFARVSNGTLTVTPDERGLKIKADLGGTELGRQLYEEIKGGYTDKMSFGFRVNEDDIESREEDGVVIVTRTITDVAKLYDVSAVSLPANDATSISAINISARTFSEGVIAEVKEEYLAHEKRERQKRIIKLLTEV